MSIAKAPGAQFEISIDGTPRTYRDRKPLAIEAAEYLKRKQPNSAVMVKDLQSGETTAVAYKPDLGRFNNTAPPLGSPPTSLPPARSIPFRKKTKACTS